MPHSCARRSPTVTTTVSIPRTITCRCSKSCPRKSSQATATDVLRAQYDVLLTEALLRLAYHLSFGKVDPETFDAQWNYGRTLARRDIAQEVEEALASTDIYQRVEALKPTHYLYVELKRELARYRAAASSADWPTIAAGAPLTAG